MLPFFLQEYRKAALVIAHPGHELRLLGWVNAAKPEVSILTDGSGRSGVPRLESSRRLLAKRDVSRGPLFPAMSDRAFYQAILEPESHVFTDIVNTLAQSFVKNNTDLVVCDALEGFNPTHDLCHVIAGAAALAAGQITGRVPALFAFDLAEHYPGMPQQSEDGQMRMVLSKHQFQDKVEAASEYKGLENEVSRAITCAGQDYFRSEYLKRIQDPFAILEVQPKPYYEIVGEERWPVALTRWSSAARTICFPSCGKSAPV